MNTEVVVYQAADGSIELPVRLEEDTVWLNQKQMAELFGVTPENILIHLKNIYASEELDQSATAKKILVVQKEGGREVTRQVLHYALDAIISVGYRVNSKQGSSFRIWATNTLRDHLLKGYTLNQRRLAANTEELKTALDSRQISESLLGKAPGCRQAARVTPSMRSSREVLKLDHLYVVCHGEGDPWPLAEGITAVPARCLASPQWQPV